MVEDKVKVQTKEEEKRRQIHYKRLSKKLIK